MTWRYARTSIAGTSHVVAQKACDDACHCERFTTKSGQEYLIGVVSDGAGSAELSRFGSELVVNALSENARQWLSEQDNLAGLTREVVLDWLDNIRDCIFQLAATEFTDPKDYAATLIFAIVGKEASAFGQIGDGAVVVAGQATPWSAVFWPQHGEYANQTYFVTGERAHEQLAFEVRSGAIDDVVMFTDGLERVLLDFKQRQAHPPVFERMIGPLRRSGGAGEIAALSEQLSEYLASPGITAHTDDDVTLVIATRRGTSAPPTSG